MTVSSRHIFIGTLACASLLSLGGLAFAGGGPKGGKPAPVPGVQRPNVPRPNFKPVQPKAPRPAFQPRVVIPSVNVQAPTVIVQQGAVSVDQSFISLGGATAFAGATGFPGGAFFGGGGFATPSTPISPSALDGLVVDGADQTITETVTRQVPVTEETCVPQSTKAVLVRPVQAVCIDDKGTPHPASRIDAEETVSDAYNGEVFRCLAGTYMQVTLGQIENGRTSFAQGETFSCQKGEALVHRPGGQLTCAPQSPQRNCNERSLLRRHGPGIKLVRTVGHHQTCVPTQRVTYKTVTNQVQRVVPNQNGPIVLDGGVGQGVF